MRLLLATRARGPIGGVESYLRGLAPRLAARGHELALLVEQRWEAAPAPAPDPYAACEAEWDVSALGTAAVLAAARAWGPERIWAHSLHNGELEAGLLAMAPAVLYAHNYGGLCATGEKFQRRPRPHPCARRMGAACAVINFTQNCGYRNPLAFAAQFQQQRQRAGRARGYERILVASRAMQRAWRQRLGGTGPPVSCLPYPCVEVRDPAPAPRAGSPARLLMLARLTAGKGGALLLEAMQEAEARLDRKLSLTLAGSGPELPRLQRLAQRLGCTVEFPGWLSEAQRRRAFTGADVIVIPSVWPEPFGLTGLEAAAHAVPAVAFAVGGIPDWLQPGITGEAAPLPPSAAGLAAALVRALGDDGHWQALRAGAWKQTAAFSMEAHLDRLEELLAGSRGAGA